MIRPLTQSQRSLASIASTINAKSDLSVSDLEKSQLQESLVQVQMSNREIFSALLLAQKFTVLLLQKMRSNLAPLQFSLIQMEQS